MTTIDHSQRPRDITVECHLRGPSYLEPIETLASRLQACSRRGTIDSVLFRSWPERVALDDQGPRAEIAERFERFSRWADGAGVRIEPPFRRRTVRSMVGSGESSVLEIPVCCLALYREGELLGVYPHEEDGTTRTVEAVLDAFEEGRLPAPIDGAGPVGDGSEGNALGASGEGNVVVESSSERTATDGDRVHGGTDRLEDHDVLVATTGPETCPSCDGQLLNVQGVLACEDCAWTPGNLVALNSPTAKLVYLALLDGPLTADSLKAALGLRATTLYSVLRTLRDREFVEEAPGGRYRARPWSESPQRENPPREIPGP